MKNGPQNCEMVSRKSRLLGAAAAKKEEGKFIFLINRSLYLSALSTHFTQVTNFKNSKDFTKNSDFQLFLEKNHKPASWQTTTVRASSHCSL